MNRFCNYGQIFRKEVPYVQTADVPSGGAKVHDMRD